MQLSPRAGVQKKACEEPSGWLSKGGHEVSIVGPRQACQGIVQSGQERDKFGGARKAQIMLLPQRTI